MSSVDNRVVRMVFDNAQFEKNVKATMETLSNFEKKLKLEGATAGFDVLEKAADKLNLSTIGQKATQQANEVEKAASDASTSIASIEAAGNKIDFSNVANNADDMASEVSKASTLASESINSVDDSAQNANFSPIVDAAYDAVSGIDQALGTLNFSSIADGTQEASNSFSVFETIATGALLGVGNEIKNFVFGVLGGFGNKVKKFMIDPISEGFQEYQTQISSIQTILANTGMSFTADEDIGLVNEVLDELNHYADKTIYNFTEMTRNIGTFTAAGIELEPAKDAIQGIANLAALSGSNSQQASTAMYQLSQALAAGTLKLQDWNSVVNAGMGGQVFQEALKRTARAHGIAVDEMIEDAGSFRESLQAGWITSEILTETLNQMAISYEEVGDEAYNAAMDQMLNSGYSKEDAEAILKLAKAAEDSATQVRTWDQLWDTVKESIGSNWSSVWRNVIGDFKQATDTFTFLSNNITATIDGLLGGIVHSAETFNSSGAWDLIFGNYIRDSDGNFIRDAEGNLQRIKGVLDYFAEAIGKPLRSIGDAFNSVFGMDDDSMSLMIVSIALAFRDFAASLVISDNAAIGLRQIFEGLFSILDIGIQIVMDLSAAFFAVVGALRVFIDPLIDIALTIGGQVGKLLLWLHDRFLDIRAAVIEAAQPLFEMINILETVISAILHGLGISDKIQTLGDGLLFILDIIWNFIDIPGKIRLIGDALKWIFDLIGNITGWNKAANMTRQTLEATGKEVSVLDMWFKILLDNPIISFFKKIYDAVKQAITVVMAFVSGLGNNTREATKNVNPLLVAFESIKSVFASLSGPVLNFFKNLGTIIIVPIGLMSTLVKAIGSLAKKFGEAFIALKPVQDIIHKLLEFKDVVVSFAIDIPNKISQLVERIKNSTTGIQQYFVGVVEWFNGIVSYFSNVTVDRFLADVAGFFNGIIEKIKETFNFFATLTPEKLVKTVSNFFEYVIRDIDGAIHAITDTLFGKHLEGIGTKIADFWYNNIFSPVFDMWQNAIKELFEIANNSKNIPEFIVNLFTTIVDKVKDGINGMLNAVKSFRPEDLLNILTGFVDILSDLLGNAISNFIPTISNITSSIKDFFTNLFGNADNWSDVFKNALDGMLTALMRIPVGIAFIFDIVRTKIVEGLTWIADHLKSIPGPVGEFFTQFENVIKIIGDTISNIFSKIKSAIESFVKIFTGSITETNKSLTKGSEGIPVKSKTFFGSIIDWIKQTIEWIKNAIGYFKEFAKAFYENLPETLVHFFENFKSLTQSKVDDLLNFLHNIPEKLQDFIDRLSKVFNSERIKNIIAIIRDIKLVVTLKQTSGAISQAKKTLKELALLYKTQRTKLKKEDHKSFTDALRSVAISMAIMGATLYIISQIPNPMDAVYILVGLALVLTTMVTISGILEKSGFANGGKNLLMASGSLGLFALSMLIAMKSIEKLTKFDWAGNIPGIIAFGIFFSLLVGAMTVITKFGGDGGSEAIKVAAAMVIMAVALRLLLIPLEEIAGFVKEFNEDEIKKVDLVLAALIAFMAFMMIFLATVNKDNKPVAASLGFLILAAGLKVMASAIIDLNNLDIPHMILGLITLGAFLGSFFALVFMNNSSDILKASAAMVIYAGAIYIMATAIGTLNDKNPASLLAGLIPLAAIIGEFMYMVKNFDPKKVVAVAGGLIVFGLALAAMSAAIYGLSSVPWEKILPATAALTALVGAFGLLVSFTKEADILTTAGAMMVFGLAIAAMAFGISTLEDMDWTTIAAAGVVLAGLMAVLYALTQGANAIDLFTTAAGIVVFSVGILGLAVALNIMSDTLIKLAVNVPVLATFADIINSHFLEFAAAAAAMVLLGAGLGVLGAGLVIFGIGALAGSAGIALLIAALESLYSFASQMQGSYQIFHDLGYNIIAGIGQGIVDGIGAIIISIIELPFIIINKLKELLKINSPSGVMADAIGQFIPAGIGEGILNGSDNLVETIISFISGLLARIQEWAITEGLPMLQEQLAAFWTWLTTEGVVKFEELAIGLLDKLREFASNVWIWFTTEGMPMIGEALAQFWNWVTTEGIPKLGEFIGWILSKLGEFAGLFLNWLSTDGVNMLGTALTQFWNWVTTEGIPKLGEFIGWIFSKLGELLEKLGSWIISDGLPAVGSALKSIMEKAGELGGMLLTWAGELPGKIWDGLGNIAQWAGEMGQNIINGIVEGIKQFPDAIADAVISLASGGLDAIKRFFGISSPSKVMRDQVGQWIPKGIGLGILKFASYAIDAAEDVATDTADAVNNGIGDIDTDLGTMTASVIPVVSFENFDATNNDIMSNLSALLDGVSLNNNLNNAINAQMDVSNMIAMIDNQTSKITKSLETLSDTVINSGKTNSEMVSNKIMEAAAMGSRIYMDTGSLVGAIASTMDQQLGYREILSRRGLY